RLQTRPATSLTPAALWRDSTETNATFFSTRPKGTRMRSKAETMRHMTSRLTMLPLLAATVCLFAAPPAPVRAQLGDSDKPQGGKSATPKPRTTKPRTPARPPRRPTPQSRNLVVSQRGGAAYRTIGDALLDAPSGARILVKAGTYAEGLNVDRGVELVAD